MSDITEFLGVGKEHAVKKQDLMKRTGLTDREVRKAIELAQIHTPIINNQDGRGYYIANNQEEYEAYIKQEKSRAMSLLKKLKYIKKHRQNSQLNEMIKMEVR